MNSDLESMAAYYFWMVVVGVVVYMAILDKNVVDFIYLFFLGVWVQLKKYYYMVRLHPFWIMNPVGKYFMMRKYRKLAEEIKSNLETESEEVRTH